MTNGWDDNHPIGAPVVVVSHHAPEDTAKWPRTTFVASVADGIARAREIAGGKDVTIASAEASEDYITIINKTHGAGAADAAVTILPAGRGLRGAHVMTLAGEEPGGAAGTHATLGGAAITGAAPWEGKWSALPADPQAGVSLTVEAATAAIVRIRGRS
jgi:hypothetical protein